MRKRERGRQIESKRVRGEKERESRRVGGEEETERERKRERESMGSRSKVPLLPIQTDRASPQ